MSAGFCDKCGCAIIPTCSCNDTAGERYMDRIAELERQLAKLKQDRDRYHLALQGLTPGGSEFYGDPEACVAFVREARASQQRVLVRLKRQVHEALEDNELAYAAAVDVIRERDNALASLLSSVLHCTRLRAEVTRAREELSLERAESMRLAAELKRMEDPC